ncbi:hypothetical protein GKE20_25695 [Escherichia coli]|nr:hypothetical protein [Escherichia coli]
MNAAPGRAFSTLGNIPPGAVFSTKRSRKFFYTGGRRNHPLPFSTTLFHSMSLSSSRPSIIWELSGDPCATQEEALSGIKHDTEAFIICNRGNEFLQAACNDPESYHCEISFVNGKNRELYIAPKDLDYS